MVHVYFIHDGGTSFYEWVNPEVIPMKGDEVRLVGYVGIYEVVRRRVSQEFRTGGQRDSVVYCYVQEVTV